MFKKSSSRRKPGTPWSLSHLEPRLMLAGDAGDAVASATVSSVSSMQSEIPSASETNVVVFVDAGASDLMGATTPIVDGATLILLTADRSGVEQIQEHLSTMSSVRQVHLVSHATAGHIQLGSTLLSMDNLNEAADGLRAWSKNLASDADILLYGCDLAGNAAGKMLVREIARLTDADVAASDDRTANAAQLGDWDLEYNVGAIESKVALTAAAMNSYDSHLAIEISAAGSTGQELLQVIVDEELITTLEIQNTGLESRNFQTYTVDFDGADVNDIRLNFINDIYDPNNGIDRNVGVDYIRVDGVQHDPENLRVYSSGAYFDNEIQFGYFGQETLSVNGFLDFGGDQSGPNGSTVQVFAAGETGTEQMQLWIDGKLAAEYENIPNGGAVYTYQAYGNVIPEAVGVALTNDFSQDGFDRNLYVDRIEIDGAVYQTEDPSVFTTGHYTQQYGITHGFYGIERLSVNGYFQYSSNVNNGGGGEPGGGGNAGSFSLFTSEVTTVEGQGSVTFEVQRLGGSSGNATINYFTASDTAIEGQDFQQTSGQLFFADGETAKQFTVDIFNDSESELTEQFSVRIDNPTGADLLAPRTSIVTLLDDDSGLPRFGDFNSAAGLTFNGSASTQGGALQLTGAGNQQAGTAFFNTPIAIDSQTSFRSEFTFQIGGGSGGNGADGMVFLVQNSAAGLNALGNTGGFLGYDTIENSLAIEFDTNANTGDTAGDSLAVVINGQVFNASAQAGAAFDLNNNSLYYAWVDYNGDTDTLAVFVSDTPDKPVFALLKTQVQLDAIVGSQAFVGFSAATFGRPNYHRVGSWNFSLDAPDGDPPVNPTGAVIEQNLVAGLTQPLAVEWSPDGRNMFIAEKGGVIKVARDGSSDAQVVLDISARVNNVQDRGLTDFALDPNFQSNGYIYLLYTYDPPEVFNHIGNGNAGPDGRGNRVGRLERFTLDPNSGFTQFVPGSETVLLGRNGDWNSVNAFVDSTNNFSEPEAGRVNGVFTDDFINSDSRSHTVGSLAFASDGSLFVSIGDGASFSQTDRRALRVQDVNSLSGKVLRIDPATGQGLSDNPFYNGDPNSNASRVYQLGLRNPWRLTIDQATGRLYIGETGLSTFEEINTGAPGANFGWPFYEGNQGVNRPTDGYRNLPEAGAFYQNNNATPAEIALRHQDGSDTVVLGDIVYNSDLGIQYQGDLFYNDLYRGVIRHADVGADGSLSNSQVFTTGAQFVVDIQQGPDGSLYYVNLVEGTVGRWRIG